MSAAMEHLRPYFQSGEATRKGVFVIGTVAGDLHDIGKNLVAMMVEGGGWEIIDLGVDVSTSKYEAKYADIQILIGGAPVTKEFCDQIGANFYSPSPQGAVDYLNSLAS